MTETLAGKRVLVVEDEYYIASDLRRELSESGADVVGPVGDVQQALSLADEPIDAAVLDINLQGETSFAVADRLGGRAIPYMLLTGYDRWSLPDAYRGAPRLAKPCGEGAVARMLRSLLSTPLAEGAR